MRVYACKFCRKAVVVKTNEDNKFLRWHSMLVHRDSGKVECDPVTNPGTRAVPGYVMIEDPVVITEGTGA